MIIVLHSGVWDVTVTRGKITTMLLNVPRALLVNHKEKTMKMNKENV